MAEPHPTGEPGPITAVLFDFSSTLADIGEAQPWLEAAWSRCGREGQARAGLGPDRASRLLRGLRAFWGELRREDPDGERDLSPARHQELFTALLGRLPEVDAELARALYDALPEICMPYEDALPTLRELKRRRLRLGLVSNISRDLRPVLRRWEMLDLFDAVILSFEVGSVKPQAAIFQRALEALGAAPAQALMVGDDPLLDSGAALLGIRTLLLPATHGRRHGLGIVLKLLG